MCWHIGARQSDARFIAEHIERIAADPLARWIYMGDGGECVTKVSKGDVYSQTMPPGEQLNTLEDLLDPIRDKGLFCLDGNHGNRIYKETGISFDEELARRLKLPYLGTAAFWHLALGAGGRGADATFNVYTHHGIDSGVAVGGKVNKAKQLEQVVLADAIFSAHSHICCEIPPRHIAYLHGAGGGNPVKWATTRGYICGCAYDSRSGYAELKGYPPILPAHLAVTFSIKNRKESGERWIEKSQSCEVWRVEA